MIESLGDVKVGIMFMDSAMNIKGDVAAIAHKEWEKLVGIAGKLGAINFKQTLQDGTLNLHQSVNERRILSPFVQYKNQTASKYNPTNL